jgi:acyl-CoA thioesterase I
MCERSKVAGMASSESQPLREPWWRSDHMAGEPVLFVQHGEGEAPRAQLCFAVDAVIEVVSASGVQRYDLERELRWTRGSPIVELAPDSTIPFCTLAHLYPSQPPQGRPMRARSGCAPAGLGPYLMWAEGHAFHDLQVAVHYRHHDAWTGPTPTAAGERLPRSRAFLRDQKSLNVVMLGDSISTGANASGAAQIQVAPFQAPYPNVVVSELQERFATVVSLHNLSVGGKGIVWGLGQLPAVIAARPDLVLLAFGMNDTGMVTADWLAHVQRFVSALRQELPECECILVTPMIGNAEWEHLRMSAFEEFRAGLVALVDAGDDGLACADITRMWSALVERKSFLDLTGNGLNHPNDFGHRLYAEVILALFEMEKFAT